MNKGLIWRMGGRSKRHKLRKIVRIVYINHFITVITTIRCASNINQPMIVDPGL